MTRQRIQAVQDHLDKYADDREIDYLFMAFDRNTELMRADYQINEYSDDLAEGIAQARSKCHRRSIGFLFVTSTPRRATMENQQGLHQRSV